MNCQTLIFSSHAIRQMFFRRISKDDVRRAITYGEIIEENLNDTPFPSYLLLDFIKGQPLHILISVDRANKTCYVVTAYTPDPQLWQDNFRQRR